MNKLIISLAALLLSAPVIADEVGPAKPNTSTSTQTQPLSAPAPADECSLIAQWFGVCEAAEDSEY